MFQLQPVWDTTYYYPIPLRCKCLHTYRTSPLLHAPTPQYKTLFQRCAHRSPHTGRTDAAARTMGAITTARAHSTAYAVVNKPDDCSHMWCSSLVLCYAVTRACVNL